MRPSLTNPPAGHAVEYPPCCHKRLIDRVCTEDETATSQFRCLECGAVIDEQDIAADTVDSASR